MITILDSAGNISMAVIRHVIKKPGVRVMAKLEEDSPAGKFYSGTSSAYDGMLSKSHFDTSLGSMEAAIDYADKKVSEGGYFMLNQFANPDNFKAHFRTTGAEIWKDTSGKYHIFFLQWEQVVCIICDTGERYLSYDFFS